MLPLAFTDKCIVWWMFMCYFWWDSLFCSCIAHRNFLDLSTLLNWLTVLVTTPFWTLTCLFKHCPTQLCHREQGLRASNWGSNAHSVCSVLAAFIIISLVTLLVWCDISILLLLMCWQTLELGWEGRRCHIQFWQGVLWRRATVWCLQLPCSAHCFRFCVFCFILDLFFKIVKVVSYHYTLIITRLSNSHFPYSGNRCH
jgi:hypothetical protein